MQEEAEALQIADSMSPDADPRSSPNATWLYAWALGAMALGGASLLVPLYVVALGGSPVTLGVLAAAAAAVGVPAAVLFGRLADRTPRLAVLVEGLLIAVAVVLLVLPFVRSLAAIVLLNAVMWFAFAGAGPVLNLLTVAGVDESHWQTRIARLNTFQGWGWTGGLVLGALWTGFAEPRFGTVPAFHIYFFGCGTLAALAVAGLALEAPSRSAIRGLDPRRLRWAMLRAPRMNVRGATFPFTPGRVYDWAFRRLHPRRFVERFTRTLSIYYTAIFLCFTGFAVFFAPLPIFLDETGYSSGAIFTLYLVSSLGAAVSFRAVGGLPQRYSLSLLQAGGLAARGGAMPTVALVGALLGAGLAGLGTTGGLFLVIGVTWAVIAVTAATLVARLAPEGVRGEALGCYAAATALAGGVGSLAGGWLAAVGYGLAFGVAGGFIFLGAALVLGLREAEAARRESVRPELPL